MIVADGRHGGMVDVFVERHSVADVAGPVEPDSNTAACCDLHRARWQRSYVAEGGWRICHYRAPDAESVRLAFRTAGIRVDSIWSGTVHGDMQPAAAYVVADLRSPPLTADIVDALKFLQAEWLLPMRLKLAHAIVPATKDRVICMCAAPEEGFMRVNATASSQVWSCRSIAAPSAGTPGQESLPRKFPMEGL